MRRAQLRAALCIVGLVCVSTAVAAAEPNEIFDDLTTNGVTLSDGTKANLPKPAMADGLNAAAQQKAIEGLVDKAALESFLKAGKTDYVQLKITGSPATEAKKAGVRRLDLYFIANGKLETVADKGFFKKMMGPGANFHFLTEKELGVRMVSLPKDTATALERSGHTKLDLFNMANVRSTGHGISTSQPESQTIAFLVDDRFNGDKEFPNQWQSISLDKKTGKKVFSDPEIYRGSGGYMKATRLAGTSKPQLFIEYHLVFEEPFEWFKGGGVLAKNLTEKTLADVRTFREDLRNYEAAVSADKKQAEKK